MYCGNRTIEYYLIGGDGGEIHGVECSTVDGIKHLDKMREKYGALAVSVRRAGGEKTGEKVVFGIPEGHKNGEPLVEFAQKNGDGMQLIKKGTVPEAEALSRLTFIMRRNVLCLASGICDLAH